MNSIRAFLIMVALIAATACIYFGNMEIKDGIKQIVDNTAKSSRFNPPEYHEIYYTVTSHSGINGAAIGMGVISGMCFLALGVTYIGKEEK